MLNPTKAFGVATKRHRRRKRILGASSGWSAELKTETRISRIGTDSKQDAALIPSVRISEIRVEKQYSGTRYTSRVPPSHPLTRPVGHPLPIGWGGACFAYGANNGTGSLHAL